jgi:putative transposase
VTGRLRSFYRDRRNSVPAEPANQSQATQALLTKIHAIRAEFPGYGYRRVTHALKHQGVTINHKKVMRVMPQAGLTIRRRARVVTTTNSNHDFPIYRNLYRNVIPSRPDQVWVADITYIRLNTGFVFLAVILDACSRKVVGYALAKMMSAQLALAALETAINNRKPKAGLIHHSDRGSQYASQAYRDALKAHNILGSMMSNSQPVRQRSGRELHEDLEARRSVDPRLRNLAGLH